MKTNNFQTVTHLIVSVSVKCRDLDQLEDGNASHCPMRIPGIELVSSDRKYETENNPLDFESHEGRELVTIER